MKTDIMERKSMYFTKEMLQRIAKEELELVHKYSDCYEEMKSAVDTSAEYDVIWAEGLAEPYYIAYIKDIEKMPERKIFKKEPKNKAFAAKHFFKDGRPVYSVFMDDKGEPVCEKFFSEQGNVRLGAMYYGRRLSEISTESFDDERKPVSYRCTSIKKDIGRAVKMTCKCFVYDYEDKHIVSAWCIDSFDISKGVTMYDDPMYNDWKNRGLEYQMSTAPMNPNFVAEYNFTYGESGSPSEYSRTEYRYCNVSTGQWKASKKVFEQFNKNGIGWFIIAI
ncbi:MAG: hypothetical protein ACI4I2_01040 [Oscillospiraceae bacterium]